MKIALLFDGLSALGKAPEVQLLDSIEAVESALSDWATEVVRVPVSNDGRWVERVRKGKFDLVFNLCEGIDGEAVYEPMVISVLELLGIPFTGSSSWTTASDAEKERRQRSARSRRPSRSALGSRPPRRRSRRASGSPRSASRWLKMLRSESSSGRW